MLNQAQAWPDILIMLEFLGPQIHLLSLTQFVVVDNLVVLRAVLIFVRLLC